MNFKKKFLCDVIRFLYFCIFEKRYYISVKRIRGFFNQDPDRSKINFYWRVLVKLENHNYISKIRNDNKKASSYLIEEKLREIFNGSQQKEELIEEITEKLYSEIYMN